jgi:phosphoribosylformylglycinamidine synthase II
MTLAMNQTLIALPTEGEAKFSLFWILYDGAALPDSEFQKVMKLVSDEVDQLFWVNPTEKQWAKLSFQQLQVVSFRPGVTDNAAHSFQDLLTFHPLFAQRKIKVHSGEAFLIQKNPAPFNPLIHESKIFAAPGPAAQELNQRKITEPSAPKLSLEKSVERIDLRGLDVKALTQLSKERFWALSEAEMLIIQKHFADRALTDVEIEVLAQTWSEHCKHKIFAATIDCDGEVIHGLFKTYIEKPTKELQQKKDWAISVFKDNAGIVRFHENVDLCIKVETHNSPSALDPYGGALTGILGVNRDILGTGLGARPIANTNVLCFGEPNETEPLPQGLLHPYEIFKGVHRGIQDGGNKSGIPTVNGAILFDESFSGKPLVFCGTVGVMPQTVKGIPSASKGQRAGDLIVMIGGAVGLDGIHGATSSSLALDSSTPSTMVQIGDPLTQKRVLDFMIEARDLLLYNSVTDNGAGGLSSSIGEMAEQTNGAKVYLDQVPLKYPGLLPWQIFISESQERMTLSVPKENFEKLKSLAIARGVDATVVGEFTNSGSLDIFYHEQTVGKLSLEFLHHGLPKMQLKAKWAGPQKRKTWKASIQKRPLLSSFTAALQTLVSDPSLASKEKWVRQYDHEVQAATAMKPFEEHAPNDAGIIWMGAHGNSGYSGAGIASGIAPDFSLLDGGIMATLAADEAVRNLIVTGVDPDKIALIDNFCWPDPLPGSTNPDAEHKLAQLVRTCKSLADLCRTYEMPLVSGKDSMKNDFIGKLPNGEAVKISVLPTLLVTALGYHPDVRKIIKPHAKLGSHFYLLGAQEYQHYFGMTLTKHFEIESAPELSHFDLQATRNLYAKFFQATQQEFIESAHDLSEGGLLPALFESLLLYQGGVVLDLKNILKSGWQESAFCFGEMPGRILISVSAAHRADFENLFTEAQRIYLGEVNLSAKIELRRANQTAEAIEIAKLEQSWRGVL